MMGNKDEGPRRIQLRRTKGWRMPENTVKACRPGPMGNPFTASGCREAGYRGTDAEIAARCVGAFEAWASGPFWRNNWDGEESEKARAALHAAMPAARGKNLGCWCGLCDRHKDGKPLAEHCADCDPCHVDVIGELLANPTPDPNTPHTKGGL